MLIITARQTEVLSLHQMCIDKVAETLHSPKDVRLLPLPDNIKEMIAHVVFDPNVDFCYDQVEQCIRDRNWDTVIDHEFYKNLISTVCYS